MIFVLKSSKIYDTFVLFPTKYDSLHNMYENNTQNEQTNFSAVRVTASISSVAFNYIQDIVKAETLETDIKHTFSGVLNKIIMQHKKEHERKEP